MLPLAVPVRVFGAAALLGSGAGIVPLALGLDDAVLWMIALGAVTSIVLPTCSHLDARQPSDYHCVRHRKGRVVMSTAEQTGPGLHGRVTPALAGYHAPGGIIAASFDRRLLPVGPSRPRS